MKLLSAIAVSLFMCGSLHAQTTVVKSWDLATYSATTVSNLASDTEHWTMNSKGGRYQNAVATDGGLLKACGEIIPETNGIYFAAGIKAGNLLLCYDRGSSGNGVQNQSATATTIRDLSAGQIVEISLRSSSSSQNGISAVTNLTGDVGSSYYTTTGFKTFTFTVVKDGDISFTNSGGIIIRSITISQEQQGEYVATPEITVSDNKVSLSCSTEGASIYYSIVAHGNATDYAQPYSGEFELSRSVRLRAYATKEGMHNSLTAEQHIDIPLVLPYAGKPFRLAPEALSRGAIATKASTGYLVNWRLLIDDPQGIAFNVYRNGTKLNTAPITDRTNYLDKTGISTSIYTLETLVDGMVTESNEVAKLPKGYLNIPIDRPANATTESGEYMYVPGDCMVADLDGDKEYEIVMKWDPCNTNWNYASPSMVNDTGDTAGQKDNSLSGYTGNVLIDAYRMDGTKLWRIDLGKNIRAGAHYTQLMVYDLNGDGKAEVACKTAPGTLDGKGNYVVMGTDDPSADYRTKSGSKVGMIVSGPEYLTVFSGLTGEELATCAYTPARSIISSWGDSYGNRSERYLAAVAYLENGDNPHPSLIMCRGYYTAAFIWAVDFDGSQLTTRWLHSSTQAGLGAYSEGAHTVQVADIDGDMKDEIIFGACAIDDDGTLIYRTGLGHGDAVHVGDFMPDRYGLEVMMVHEETTAEYGIEMHDALTGEHLSGVYAGSDVGRGLCADIDASRRGCEYWGYGNNVYDCNGSLISTKKPTINFRTYWDGDLYEELTEKGEITKWDSENSASTLVNFVTKYKAGVDLIKYTPLLQADIFGDWREEQVYYDGETRSNLWIFTTPYSSQYRIPTLMHDHHYRMATVWQTAAYNQPPHLSFYLPDYISQQTGIEELNNQQPTTNNPQPKLYNLCGMRVDGNYHGVVISKGKAMMKN